MPRANRRNRDHPALDVGRAVGSAARLESHPDGDWYVRALSGAQAAKAYVCPGCSQQVRVAQPHVVAWPADGARSDADALTDRRHWHTPCWSARLRRR